MVVNNPATLKAQLGLRSAPTLGRGAGPTVEALGAALRAGQAAAMKALLRNASSPAEDPMGPYSGGAERTEHGEPWHAGHA